LIHFVSVNRSVGKFVSSIRSIENVPGFQKGIQCFKGERAFPTSSHQSCEHLSSREAAAGNSHGRQPVGLRTERILSREAAAPIPNGSAPRLGQQPEHPPLNMNPTPRKALTDSLLPVGQTV
jgi:hypothetical protein